LWTTDTPRPVIRDPRLVTEPAAVAIAIPVSGSVAPVPVNISRRDYAGEADFRSLLRFTQRIYTPDSRWHLGDIAWDLGFEPGGEPDSRMSFWERDGEIVGWGWLRLPSALALLVDPGYTQTGSWTRSSTGPPR
jgi:hypothetical protein